MNTVAPENTGPRETRLRVLLMALVLVAVLWTFRDVVGFGYAMLMDDDTNLVFNPHLGAIDAERLRWMFTDIDYVARYLPLGWLGFDLAMDGNALAPFGYHVAAVGLHALNALLVLLCLDRLLGRFARAASRPEQLLAAGVGALVWALHPLRVESVAWCSGLLYLQGGFFALVTVYARLRELTARAAGDSHPARWYWLGMGAFVLSLLTYPVALFLPVIIALLDYAWFKEKQKTGARAFSRILAWETLALGALAGLDLAATIVARHVHLQNAVPPPTLAEFGLLARAFQAWYVWASYIWRTLWPVGLTPVVEALFDIRAGDVRIWGALPTLIFLTALAWRWRRTAAFFGTCWLGYLVWMIPVLGLSEYPHTAADRYSYLVGVLFSVAAALALLQVKNRGFRTVLLAAGGAVAVICGGLSRQQAAIWRDPMTLHRSVLGRLQDEDLRKITQVRMAKLRFLAGDVREGRAAAQEIYAGAPHIAGVVRTWREMAPATPLSAETLAQPLQEWPAAPWACLHESIARNQFAEGRSQDALSHLNAALALAPESAAMRYRRALVFAALGEPRSALHDWLVIETIGGRGEIGPEAQQFAAMEIAKVFHNTGEETLATSLRQRAGGRKPIVPVK